jgi:hypothetical protein
VADELVSIRIRLSGGKAAAGELKLVSTAEEEVGASAVAAGAATTRGASGISRVLGRMRGAWSAVKRVAKFGAAGLVAGGLALAYWGKKASATTENLAKATSGLHKNMGFSYERASALLSLFKVRGAEPTKVALGFKAFGASLRAAATGSESAIGVYRRLGLSQKDIQRSLVDSDFALNRVSRGFASLPPSLAKSALGAKVFGKAYEAMFPLLREGPKVLNEQIEKAKEYGAVLDGHAVTSTMEMVEAQREMQLASIGWQITFATKIEPIIVKIATAIAHFSNEMRTGTGAGGKFAAIMRVTGQVLSVTYNAIRVGIVWLVAASKATAAWASGAANAVAGGFRAFLNWITTTWNNVTGFIGDLLPVKVVLLQLGIAFKVVSTVISRFAQFVGPVLKFWLGIASVAVTNLWKTIKFMATIISDVIGIASNLLRGKWGAAWQSAKGLVGDVVHGIGEMLGGMLSFLGSLPGRILDAMKGVGKAIAAPFVWAYEKIKWVKEKIDAITGALNGGGATPTHHGPLSPVPSPGEGPGSGIGGRGPHFHDPLAPTPISPRAGIEPRIRRWGPGRGDFRGNRHGAGGVRGRPRGPLPEGRGSHGLSRPGPRGGRTRRLQPISLEVDGRTLAEVVVETQEDDEARE